MQGNESVCAGCGVEMEMENEMRPMCFIWSKYTLGIFLFIYYDLRCCLSVCANHDGPCANKLRKFRMKIIGKSHNEENSNEHEKGIKL